MKMNIQVFLRKIKTVHITYSLLIGILLVSSACGGGRDITDAEDLQDFQQLKEMVQNREFEIENQWAMPLGGNMVNLVGNQNTIRFEGDSVQVHLPYFGVRYSGGGYGSEGGIKYNGIPQDFSVEEDESKGELVVKFEGQHRNESLNFYITLYPNGNANTSVNSPQRSGISYRGDIVENSDQSEESY